MFDRIRRAIRGDDESRPTVRGEYTRHGRCGAVPIGRDAAPPGATILPCSLAEGHPGRHVAPAVRNGVPIPDGWTWPR